MITAKEKSRDSQQNFPEKKSIFPTRDMFQQNLKKKGPLSKLNGLGQKKWPINPSPQFNSKRAPQIVKGSGWR